MNWTVPGKIFLLGEYAVLADEPALLLTVGPRFELRPDPMDAPPSSPPADSPTGRLLEWIKRERLPRPPFRFEDPHAGAGGFGASTAHFALLYYAALQDAGHEASPRGARKLYRDLMLDAALAPSGADLVAQCVGGLVHFDPRSGEAERIEPRVDLSRLLIFSATGSAGRKVATHEHLAKLARLGFPRPQDREWAKDLAQAVRSGIAALGARDGGFGAVLDDYANRLAAAGFECEATRADRLALRALPGVEGCKGTGALQADVVIAWLTAEITTGQRLAVVAAARARGLRWIDGGSAYAAQAGILCS